MPAGPTEDPFQLSLKAWHQLHQDYAALFLQPALLIGYLMVDLIGLAHAFPMGVVLASPLLAFALLWLSVMALAKKQEAGWFTSACLGFLSALLMVSTMLLVVQVLLPEPAFDQIGLAALALLSVVALAICTTAWAKIAFKLSLGLSLLMGLHPLLHIGITGTLAALISRTLIEKSP